MDEVIISKIRKFGKTLQVSNLGRVCSLVEVRKMKKEKWEPEIINIMADGTVVKDLSKRVIPEGHPYYDIMYGIAKNKVAE